MPYLMGRDSAEMRCYNPPGFGFMFGFLVFCGRPHILHALLGYTKSNIPVDTSTCGDVRYAMGQPVQGRSDPEAQLDS